MKLMKIILVLSLVVGNFLNARNALVTHMYAADPTARVFNRKLYVFSSNDIVCEEGKGENGFCIPSYNVFSTEDLTNWEDHGNIIDQTKVAFRRLGVPAATAVEGPYKLEEDYIKGLSGIDPNVFIDDDGKAYLYFGGDNNLFIAELNKDMKSIKGKAEIVKDLPRNINKEFLCLRKKVSIILPFHMQFREQKR